VVQQIFANVRCARAIHADGRQVAPNALRPDRSEHACQEFSWGLQGQPKRHSQATKGLKLIAALSMSTGQPLPGLQQSPGAGLEEQPDSNIGVWPTCERRASTTPWPFTCTFLESSPHFAGGSSCDRRRRCEYSGDPSLNRTNSFRTHVSTSIR